MTVTPAERPDNIGLGILYMAASVFLFSIPNAIGKWLAQSYPIPMLVFFRSFIALLPSFLLVMRAGGLQVMRTNRLGGQCGAENAFGVAGAITCAMCNAVGTLTVRDLCRTEHSASIVTWTAIFMTLMALPALPFSWVTPTPFDFLLFCSIGLIGGVSQYWTTIALSHAPAAAVSPFNYTALIWGSIIGLVVWGDWPTPTIVAGAAI